jgi:hypothetical protein
MCLTQDKVVTNWDHFSHCVNEGFGPLTCHNQHGKLVSVRKMSTIDEYTKRFLAHVEGMGALDEQQQASIYTSGLLGPLKMDMELQNPWDMENTHLGLRSACLCHH